MLNLIKNGRDKENMSSRGNGCTKKALQRGFPHRIP